MSNNNEITNLYLNIHTVSLVATTGYLLFKSSNFNSPTKIELKQTAKAFAMAYIFSFYLI